LKFEDVKTVRVFDLPRKPKRKVFMEITLAGQVVPTGIPTFVLIIPSNGNPSSRLRNLYCWQKMSEPQGCDLQNCST